MNQRSWACASRRGDEREHVGGAEKASAGIELDDDAPCIVSNDVPVSFRCSEGCGLEVLRPSQDASANPNANAEREPRVSGHLSCLVTAAGALALRVAGRRRWVGGEMTKKPASPFGPAGVGCSDGIEIATRRRRSVAFDTRGCPHGRSVPDTRPPAPPARPRRAAQERRATTKIPPKAPRVSRRLRQGR